MLLHEHTFTKEEEMNFGTKLRTVLVIATCLNTALMATDITEFGNPTLNLIYKATSIVLNFIIVAVSHYFNNDFTEEACMTTGYMRWLKETNKGKGLGDGLQEEPETEEEEDRLEGEFYE